MGLAEMYMTFKLATSHTLDAITLIRAISDFKKPLTGLGGIDVIVKLATLDDLDNVSNLNQSIWVYLMPQGFSKMLIWMRVFQSVGTFLQSAFSKCHHGYGFNNVFSKG